MSPRACPQCGSPVPDTAKFCGACGSSTDPVPPTVQDLPPVSEPTAVSPQRVPGSAYGGLASGEIPVREAAGRTMMEFSPPKEITGRPPEAVHRGTDDPAREPQGSAAARFGDQTVRSEAPVFPSGPAAPRSPAQRTMIGMSADALLPKDVAAPAPVPAAAAAPARELAAGHKTILGMASSVPQAAAAPAPPPRGAPSPATRTMLGVARPGIAPLHAGSEHRASPVAPTPAPVARQAPHPAPPHEPVQVVPAPPPLTVEEAPPPPPVRIPKRGIPIALVGIIGGLLVVGVAAVLFVVFWRGGASIVAAPKLDPEGKELLHLRCEACKDGTVAELDGQRATFAGSEADLALTKPLHVGDNPLEVRVARAGVGGRDETVRVTVPVTFRIRADLSTVQDKQPAISVRVEALPGTDVQIEGKPLALDATGRGTYAIDISADTEGPSDESHVVSKQIAYAVTPRGGAAQRGSVAARVSVAPLRVDAPLPVTVVEGSTLVVAGRAPKGGSVTVNGKAVSLGAEGQFEDTLEATDGKLEVRATAGSMAPRTVRLSLKRVDKLEAEAKAREGEPALGYDALVADIAKKVGQSIVVEGEIVESRVIGARTVTIVDDKRGCAKGPCITRIVLGQRETLKAGETARFYGKVTRAVPWQDRSVPEVEASFVLRGKEGR